MRSYRRRDDDLMYIIETLDRRPVGCVSLYHVDLAARTAEVGRLMIGRADDEGRGYAADASRALLRHAGTALGIRLVYLQVIADNQRALTLYEGLGFVRDTSRDATIERDASQVEFIGMSLSVSPGVGPAAPPFDRSRPAYQGRRRLPGTHALDPHTPPVPAGLARRAGARDLHRDH